MAAQDKPLSQMSALCLLMVVLPFVTSRLFEKSCLGHFDVKLDVDFSLKTTAVTSQCVVGELTKTVDDMLPAGAFRGNAKVGRKELSLGFGQSRLVFQFGAVHENGPVNFDIYLNLDQVI